MLNISRRLMLIPMLLASLSSTGCSGCRARTEDVAAVSAEQTERDQPTPVTAESPLTTKSPALELSADSSRPRSAESVTPPDAPSSDAEPNGGDARSGGGADKPGDRAGASEAGESQAEGSTPDSGTTGSGKTGAGRGRGTRTARGASGGDRGEALTDRCRGLTASQVQKLAAEAAVDGDYGTAFGLGAIAWERLSATPAGPTRDRLERQLRIDLETWDKLANAKTSGDRRKMLIDAP